MNSISPVSSAPASSGLSEFLDELPLPYLEIDRNGFVTQANRAAQNLHPPQRGNLIGQVAWETIAPDEMMASLESYRALLESGETPAVVRLNIFIRTGQFRTFELHRSLIRNGEGQPSGIRILGVDVTESAKALDETRNAALWLHSVVASLPDPVLVVDAMGLIRTVNDAAEKLFGWLPGAVSGRPLEQAIPLALQAPAPEPPIDFIRILQAPARCQLTVVDSQGNWIGVEFITSPISAPQSGHLAGVVCVLRRQLAGG
ncbi:MAG: PAS domain-containing protein [Terracidiphilus sp.]|nr:PAS domain-containing protein [Terracidiphilus sp.]